MGFPPKVHGREHPSFAGRAGTSDCIAITRGAVTEACVQMHRCARQAETATKRAWQEALVAAGAAAAQAAAARRRVEVGCDY